MRERAIAAGPSDLEMTELDRQVYRSGRWLFPRLPEARLLQGRAAERAVEIARSRKAGA
jgi:hypothetical protein